MDAKKMRLLFFLALFSQATNQKIKSASNDEPSSERNAALHFRPGICARRGHKNALS
jgi:hypothetical protein